MNRTFFISIFLATHLGFVFLQIHKHTQFVKQTFSRQKNERLLASLAVKKQQLTQELYIAKNHNAIQEFAKTNLNMAPVRLGQIKQVTPHDPSL